MVRFLTKKIQNSDRFRAPKTGSPRSNNNRSLFIRCLNSAPGTIGSLIISNSYTEVGHWSDFHTISRTAVQFVKRHFSLFFAALHNIRPYRTMPRNPVKVGHLQKPDVIKAQIVQAHEITS